MIVVNFSTDSYAVPQARLRASLSGHRSILFQRYTQINSPTHQQSPYEFKIHAIIAALAIDPVVLWADSSMYLTGDLNKIERIAIETGFFGEEAGHYVGRWCNEHTRRYFSLTDDEAHQGPGGITMFSAGLMALDTTNTLAKEFLRQWFDSAQNGCFRGDWTDHRHDMTCASIIATRLGFKYQRGGSHLAYIGPGYATPEEGVVFMCQGMA